MKKIHSQLLLLEKDITVHAVGLKQISVLTIRYKN